MRRLTDTLTQNKKNLPLLYRILLLISFDTKQAPFRILFRRQVHAQALMIAEAESQKNIDQAWTWVQGINTSHSCCN